MQRYFVEHSSQNRFFLEGEDRYHIAKVMRMKAGDRIICSISGGKSAICEIAEITDERVEANVVQWKDESSELPVKVAIASGLPKGDKLDWIIQKGTELGAHMFIPFAAARSVVKLEEKKAVKKADRWQKIAKEAAEQSHRDYLPEVAYPISFKKLLEESGKFDHRLVAYEEESRKGETSRFASLLQKVQKGESMLLVFGPEGGLTEHETELLTDSGFVLCGLGPRILRTETAPLYALAAISYQLELLR